MFAHLYKVPASQARISGKSHQVIINGNARPVGGVAIPVSGAREGRQVAKAHGAIPYNF